MTGKETELVIKNHLIKKIPVPNGFIGEFY